MNAYEIPGLRFSIPAGTEVLRGRFVTVHDDGLGYPCALSDKAIGVSMNHAKAGEVLELADGIVMVETGEAIEAGAIVGPDGEGRVIKEQTGPYVAITSATDYGQFIAVKI